MYNNDLLVRFVKDTNLPITVFSDDYLDYFLDLYEAGFGSRTKFNNLLNEVETTGSVEDFLSAFYKVRENIIEDIKATPAFEKYNQMRMDILFDAKSPFSGKYRDNVYRQECVSKYYLSIDMVKANFQVMRLLDPELILNADTYQEMVGKYTDSEYIKDSKYIRQVIFGNMNPKRQTTMQKHYTSVILNYLVTNGIISESEIAVHTFDEIVLLNSEDKHFSDEKIETIKQVCKNKLGLEVSAKSFFLKSLTSQKDAQSPLHVFYVKELKDGSIDFKCVPAHYFPQVYKKYMEMPIEEQDLTFYFEHQVCKFTSPLFG